ncbi:hypothetical protein GCM10009765_03460 [Fodinicola feengrottensis]|uniref:Uncharacterized protein n=1 Tax=Fodinicola feengrottensis TaxID=435914 RepID=A0ABN2FRC3_9ACTN
MTYIAPPPLALPVRRPAPDRGLVTDLDPDVLPRQAVPAGRPGPPLRTLSTDPGWAERLIAEYTQPGDLVVNLDGITALAAAAGRLGRRSINIAATEAHLNALCRLRESALPGTRRAIMRVGFVRPEKVAAILTEDMSRVTDRATLVVASTRRADPADRTGLLPAIRAVLRPSGYLATVRVPATPATHTAAQAADPHAPMPRGSVIVVALRNQLPVVEPPTSG